MLNAGEDDSMVHIGVFNALRELEDSIASVEDENVRKCLEIVTEVLRSAVNYLDELELRVDEIEEKIEQ